MSDEYPNTFNRGNENAFTTLNRITGAGKAFQAVSQSAAISVQDAADYMRSNQVVSTAAVGAAFAQMLNQPDGPDYTQVIDSANQQVNHAAGNFKRVGQEAADLLNNFPVN